MRKDEVKLYPLVYSAPRRFDLATVLAVTIAYALLFTLMRLLDFPAIPFLWLAALFTVVAVGQALLFGGNRPRKASVVSGMIYLFVTLLMPGGFLTFHPANLFFLCTFIWFGPLVCYLAGALVGGVFLVADKIRCQLNRKGGSPAGTDANSPWDEPEDEPIS